MQAIGKPALGRFEKEFPEIVCDIQRLEVIER